MPEKNKINRRQFLGTLAAASTVSIVPSCAIGGAGKVAPNDRIITACIGVGSQGIRVMLNFLRQPGIHILSVCDVNKMSDDYVEWGQHELRDKARELLNDPDWGSDTDGAIAGREPAKQIVEAYYGKQNKSGKYKSCSDYNDYRELLEKEKIDAIIIGTPDHLHTVISVDAMQKGKHVYCQKPLTHSVYEARRIAEVTRETGVATQVATGNSASEDTRLLMEWIAAGVIGPVRQVYNWSSRPFWPQGIERPTETPPVSEGLDWDLWLGPASFRPYHPVYLPFIWRGWYDFGTGCLGDMGCYSFDTIFRVLKLEAPTSVFAGSTKLFEESFPAASIVYFEFPARGDMPPVKLTWYDGLLKPPIPPELDENELEEEGLLFIGDQGKILCGFNGRNPRLIPKSKMDSFVPPPKTLPRSIGHDEEWIRACKGGEPAGANFEFAGKVTETLMLGNIAVRTGKKLYWDPEKFEITNNQDANKYIKDNYREGWVI